MKRKYKRAPRVYKDNAGNEWISAAELADRCDVTQPAIIMARAKKWIRPVVKNDSEMYLHPDAMEAYLARAPMRKQAQKHKPAEPEEAQGEETAEELAPNGKPYYSGVGRPRESLPSSPGSLQSATASKASFAAALLQLEYEQRLGNLVPREAVDAIWKSAGESLKKSLMSIPDRIAPQFGGANRHKLYRALVTELTHALAALQVEYSFPPVAKKQGRPLGR